jgi:hypothetical protein
MPAHSTAAITFVLRIFPFLPAVSGASNPAGR